MMFLANSRVWGVTFFLGTKFPMVSCTVFFFWQESSYLLTDLFLHTFPGVVAFSANWQWYAYGGKLAQAVGVALGHVKHIS
jgi:hypothetical protein